MFMSCNQNTGQNQNMSY